jgi:hypothetical protein
MISPRRSVVSARWTVPWQCVYRVRSARRRLATRLRPSQGQRLGPASTAVRDRYLVIGGTGGFARGTSGRGLGGVVAIGASGVRGCATGQLRVSRLTSRLTSATVSGIRPGSAGGRFCGWEVLRAGGWWGAGGGVGSAACSRGRYGRAPTKACPARVAKEQYTTLMALETRPAHVLAFDANRRAALLLLPGLIQDRNRAPVVQVLTHERPAAPNDAPSRS